MLLPPAALAVSLLLAFACRNAPAAVTLTPMQFRGVALAHVHRRGQGYGSGASSPLLARLKKRGINLIQLNPFGAQPSLSERTIAFADPTLTDEDLRREIRAIHALGLSVMIAPHLWVGREDTPTFWRNELAYKDPREAREWFAAYRRFILHFAEIARSENVAVFAVGVELEKLTVHADHFRALIRDIRRLGYQGLLTYECEAWSVRNIKFWDELDFIGLNFYYSHKQEVRHSDREDFRGLTEFLAGRLQEHYAFAKEIRRPVVLTEFGYPGHSLAISKTSAWPSTMAVRDDAAQVTGFAALRDALGKAGLPGGIIFWKYVTTLDSYERRNFDTDFILEGKPAERVMDEIVRLR